MPHRVLIRLHAGGATEWLAQGRDGSVLQGPLPGLPGAAGDETVLLLPAEDVLLLEAPRIGGSRAQLAQALPFAIEDQLAAAIETQQVAFDERAGGDTVPVAVIARAQLDAALGLLRDAGIQPDAAYAESQLLPFDVPTVLVESSRALLRWSRSGALVSTAQSLGIDIELLRAADVPFDRLHVFGAMPTPLPADVNTRVEPVAAPLAWLAGRLGHVAGPNLLQGDYRPPRRHAEASGLWRWAAAMAVAAVLLGFAHAAVERAHWQSVVAERQAEMEQLLRHALPGVQRIVDPVAQMRIELERSSGQQAQGALPLLARIAPVIAGSGRYTLEGLEYRGGTLEMVIVAPDVAELDKLRESLSNLAPLQVELTSATPGSRGVEGRLRVRGGAA
jgi:general secretion pathway protein L